MALRSNATSQNTEMVEALFDIGKNELEDGDNMDGVVGKYFTAKYEHMVFANTLW